MSFPLVGNERLTVAVANALRENRLPHALLIEGDEGTGRHTLAYFLAKSIICGKNGEFCGECRNCKMQVTAHPDVTLIAPAEDKKSISVDDIRKLKADLPVKPHMALRRVFIIDSADTMNPSSQNALLKVLEEPPESVAFILIAESKANLLDTVISRCISLSLTAPPKAIAEEYIEKNFQFDAGKISDALAETHCNIGKALKLLKGEEKSENAESADMFIKAFCKKDAFGMLKTTAKFEKSRVDTQGFVKELKLYIFEQIKASPEGVRAKDYIKLYEAIASLEESLVTNINLTLFFSTLVSRALDI